MSDPTPQEKRKGSWLIFWAIIALLCLIPVGIFMMIPQENKLAWRLMAQGYQITHNFDGDSWMWPLHIVCNEKTQFSKEALQQFPKFRHVHIVRFERMDCSELDLEPLTQMPQLKSLLFNECTNLQPGEILNLKKSPTLEYLSISGTALNPETLESVESLPLVCLFLTSCELTDREMESVSKLTKVNFLNVANNPNITDAGLEYFLELKHLNRLELRGTGVTRQGIKDFRAKHPNGGSMEIYDNFTP